MFSYQTRTHQDAFLEVPMKKSKRMPEAKSTTTFNVSELNVIEEYEGQTFIRLKNKYTFETTASKKEIMDAIKCSH